jgi:hypothetical protein
MYRRTITRSPRRTSVVPVVAVALGLAMCGCSGDPSGEASTGATRPTIASEPGDAASATQPHLTGDAAALEPGAYQFSFLTRSGAQPPDAVVEVPDGYLQGDDGADWYVVSDDGEEFLGLWVIDRVDHDACLHEDADAFDPGPSVADLAEALVAQRSTRAAAPELVTLSGHAGLYVELAGPPDLSDCGKYPGLWRHPERPIYGGGQVDRVWILDVDGRRLAVDASYGPGSTAAERNQLTSMVDSLEFVAAG